MLLMMIMELRDNQPCINLKEPVSNLVGYEIQNTDVLHFIYNCAFSQLFLERYDPASDPIMKRKRSYLRLGYMQHDFVLYIPAIGVRYLKDLLPPYCHGWALHSSSKDLSFPHQLKRGKWLQVMESFSGCTQL